MYRFKFKGIDNINQYEELIKVFLHPSEYEICKNSEGYADNMTLLEYPFEEDKDLLKRKIYRDLAGLTGKNPKWGILTGIRPVKLAGEIQKAGRDIRNTLKSVYLLHPSKADMTADILEYQRKTAGLPERNSLSLYLGIPFCPSRCLYCSFTSNQAGNKEIDRYLEALYREIEFCGSKAEEAGFRLESVYLGGGTPTTLNADQMDRLLAKLARNFSMDGICEYTVEAGRPDTIREDKLSVLKDHGVDRISINPQTMKEETLDLIGRKHTSEDVYRAFELASKIGFTSINTDLIAGLPGESPEDFAQSLGEILRLGASNITLHTLAVKRASCLKEMDGNFNYRDELTRERMLTEAHSKLGEAGYRPYYLYRQKHTSGNTENTGFCRDDLVSVYNIRIMEEMQSILALGAGGISKLYFPKENRLERVANVSNYQIYIERLDDMLRRKIKGFFINN